MKYQTTSVDGHVPSCQVLRLPHGEGRIRLRHLLCDLGGVFDETLLVNDAMCHAAN